ncbi:MAG: rhodanese-like domain-containing protein [Schwartzia sp.]|nr:rhodanese-like domain-containing protein [Schwartzia sp. (in: firmicutes)]
MKKNILQKTAALFLLLLVLLAQGCGGPGYKHIGMDEAAKMMKADKSVVIVDVRTQEEYDKKHVRGAICVPIEDIRAGKLDKLPDKNKTLMLYCWTGRRSADSAAILAKQGYKNVYEFGGLVDWTGDVEGADVEKK